MSESFSFQLSDTPFDIASVREALADDRCGAYAQFEGWVRNVNEGRKVVRLEYEAHAPLAETEGLKILHEAKAQFGITSAICIHRTGLLELGDCAVIVGVTSAHRDAAFRGCRYIIDEVKIRLPIWKKEHYADGASEWINCQQ